MCQWKQKSNSPWITQSGVHFNRESWEDVFGSSCIVAVHDLVEEDNIRESGHRIIVESWMNYVNMMVEPLADVLPEETVKYKGRPWEL